MKSVFITGASRGIGLAMVKKFKSEGYQVAGCATSEKSVEVLRGVCDLALVCDVGNLEQVRVAIAEVVSKFGKIDLLINNAGVAGENSLKPEESDELWHKIINVNLNGTYYVCKNALPHIPEGGKIINISSVLGLKGVPDATAYCAAKHGVVGFTKALALRLARKSITVNAVCPGWVETDMAKQRLSEIGIENFVENTVPLRRMVQPEEVADFSYFIANASSVTGQALTIDGGVLA